MNKKLHLCRPNRKLICELNSVALDTVRLTEKLNDIDELSFEVDKLISLPEYGLYVQGNGYDDLHDSMEIYLEDIGFFQIQEPSVEYSSEKEKKVIVAYAISKELVNKNLTGFKINCGSVDSMEMLIDGNVNSLGFPNEYITLYNESNSKLSLLDIVLESAPGWTVGYVSESLKSIKLSFDIDNTNIFAFLTNMVSKDARCIFKFDTINKKVNVYKESEIGVDTGVLISLDNLANSINVSCSEDSIYTRFSVTGSDGIDIRTVNYGDDKIEDLSYYLNTRYLNSELIEKYNNYLSFREENRELYIEKMQDYEELQEKLSDFRNRVPNDGCLNEWGSMPKEELDKNLKYYNALLASLQVSVDPSPSYSGDTGSLDDYIPITNSEGETNHEWYMEQLSEQGSGVYTYEEIYKYIIPNITIALSNIDLAPDEQEKYVDGWRTEWDYYGLIELQGFLNDYNNQLESLSDYSKSWNELTEEEKNNRGNNEALYNQYHNEYVKIDEIIGDRYTNGSLKHALYMRQNQISGITSMIGVIQEDINSLVSQSELRVGNFDMTEEDIEILNILYKDTGCSNENILITSLDNTPEKRNIIRKELLSYAKEQLSISSQPQYSFSVNTDNIYDIPEFQIWGSSVKTGNFIRLNTYGTHVEKMRIVEITYNPCVDTNDLELSFSNVITCYSKRDDFSYLFGDAVPSGNSTHSYGGGSKDSVELSTDVLNLIANSRVFQGKFDNLRLQSIVSSEGVFNQIIADKAFITSAEIEKLLAEKAYITKLEADDLYANKGEFGSISATVGKIDTLMFGSASGDVIQTNFSNSVIAQLGEAQIQSAMIAGLDAGKINAGSIYTNKVHILGDEDGRLSIIDNTIAISDGTRTRVQIGKDAIGDYNMYVWDKQGNIMFDALGLTEKGVNRPVIRDDVVQEGANISASKLNIDSLFTVINDDNTPSLKSTKVVLDEKGQTLDVAFRQMKSSSLQGVEVQYALSDSATVPPTEGWSSDAPTWAQGKYMWQKTVTTNANGEEMSSAPTCIQGAKGEDGTGVAILGSYDTVTDLTNTHPMGNVGDGYIVGGDLYVWDSVASSWKNVGRIQGEQGIGVKDVVDEYYLSSSSLTQTGGEWSTESPTWQNGFYIWTRSKITWTDNSISYTNPVLATMFNSAMSDLHTMGTELEVVQGKISSKVWQQDIDNLEIGGRNYIINSSQDIVLTGAGNETTMTNNKIYFQSTEVAESLDGKEVTVSFDCENNVTDGSCFLALQTSWKKICDFSSTLNTESKRYNFTFTMPDITHTSSGALYLQGKFTGSITLRNIKLEIGNKATDWSPAPEDQEIEIGGRNLVLKSDFSEVSSTSVWSIEDGVATAYAEETGILDHTQNRINLSVSDYIYNCSSRSAILSIEYFVEEAITYGSTQPWVGAQLIFYNDTTYTKSYDLLGGTKFPTDISTSWNKYVLTIPEVDLSNSVRGYVRFYFRDAKGKVKFRHPKLEIGNRATDWTLAPEDTDTQISTLTTQYSTLEQKVDSIESTVSETCVTKDELDATVSQMSSAIEQKASSIISTVSQTYTTKEEFNNLEIGGTQILRNTQTTELGGINNTALWSEGIWRKASGNNGTWESIDITDCPEPSIKKGWKITSNGDPSTTMQAISIAQEGIPLIIGDEYILSCYIRGSGTASLNTTGTGGGSKTTVVAVNDSAWKKYTHAFTAQHTNEQKVYIGVRYPGDSMEFCGMKLERGNKATAWTPAPEDTDVKIASVETIATQTADKFNWIVKSGTSITDFTLTDRMATLTASMISLNGNVKVNGNMVVDSAITASKIATNAITADKIAANAITASKVAIGDFQNYATVDEDIPESMLPSTFVYGGTTRVSSTKNWFKKTTASRQSLMLRDFTTHNFSVGDELLVSFDVITSDTGFTIKPFVWSASSLTYTNGVVTAVADGTSSAASGSYVTPTSTTTSHTFTIPITQAIVDKPYWTVGIYGGADFANKQINVKNVSVRLKTKGELIVDGSITANHLSVSTLSAISANLGTVKAGIIQSTNYVSDSAGMKLTLSDGVWDSKYFKIASDGKITASGGTIGKWNISTSNTDGFLWAETTIDSETRYTVLKCGGDVTFAAGAPSYINTTGANLQIWHSGRITSYHNAGIGASGSTEYNYIEIFKGHIYSYHKNDRTNNGVTTILTPIGLEMYDSILNVNEPSSHGISSACVTYNTGSFPSMDISSDMGICISASSVWGIQINSKDSGVDISAASGEKINFYIGGTEYINTPVSIASNGIHVRTGSGIRGIDSEGTVKSVMIYNSSSSLVTIGTQGSSNTAVNVTISTPTLSIQTGTAFTSNRAMTVSSDIRVKTNINVLSDKYTKILDMLDAKTFRYTYDTDYKLNCGFIAQDVLSSLSECGLTASEFGGFADVHGDGSHYALDYTQFIPILWQEVKKLRQQVKELKGENS